MAIATRSVIVPNTDSGIQYSGPWFQTDQNAYNNAPFGPPLQSTLHGVNANASFSYIFSGTQVVILGTSKTGTTTDGRTDPSWTCLIDGVSNPSRPGSPNGSNNWILCENYQLTDAQHNITVQATVLNQNTFWFDHIQYAPSITVSLDQALVALAFDYPLIQYAPAGAWNAEDSVVEIAVNNSATMTYDFIGISLRWIGLIPTGYPLTSASATYSIDGGTPVSFNVPASTNGSVTTYNQPFFQTPQLSPGQHQIEVIHGGNNQTTPLTIETLLIQNATSTTTSSSETSPPTPPPGTSAGAQDSGTSSKKFPIGAVIGGVVGGIALIVILIVILIRRRRPEVKPSSPIDLVVEPFLPSFSGPAIQSSVSVNAATSGKLAETYGAPSWMPNAVPLVPNRNPVHSGSTDFQTSILSSSTGIVTAPLSGFGGQGSGISQVVRHEDSGVRLPSRAEDAVLELPPLYTRG